MRISHTEFIAVAADATGLRVFFGFLLFLLRCVSFYIVRNRKKFFGFSADADGTSASANLRMRSRLDPCGRNYDAHDLRSGGDGPLL